jgi:hypothetical protein
MIKERKRRNDQEKITQRERKRDQYSSYKIVNIGATRT